MNNNNPFKFQIQKLKLLVALAESGHHLPSFDRRLP